MSSQDRATTAEADEGVVDPPAHLDSAPVLLLLGSGISLAAGLPGVPELTRAVLGQRVVRHTDSTYREIDAPRDEGSQGTAHSPASEVKVAAAYEMIAIAAQIARRSYEPLLLEVTYEDVFEVIREISRGVNSHAPGPAIAPTIAEVTARWMSPLPLAEGAIEALACVRGIIRTELTKPYSGGLEYLDAVLGATKESSGCDIFTLNHDLLLETRMEQTATAFKDGFGEIVGLDLGFWDDDFDEKVRLYKLHGGIDWYWYNLPDAPERSDCPARCTGDPARPRAAPGVPFSERIWPAFEATYLTGIGSKYRAYQAEPFADLMGHFQARLRQARNVVVAGYGFADSGINDRLLAWIRRDASRRLTVVDPVRATKLRTRLEHLSDLARVTRRWIDDGRLVHMERRLEQVTWVEVKTHLV